MALTAEIAAWIESVTGTRVVGDSPLYTWRPGAPELIELADGRHLVLRQAPDHAGRRDGYARESAAQVLAEDHDVPAPRLIAVDVDGSVAGHPALLMTAVPRTSRIPVTASVERLEAMGAAAARTAGVRTGPNSCTATCGRGTCSSTQTGAPP